MPVNLLHRTNQVLFLIHSASLLSFIITLFLYDWQQKAIEICCFLNWLQIDTAADISLITQQYSACVMAFE